MNDGDLDIPSVQGVAADGAKVAPAQDRWEKLLRVSLAGLMVLASLLAQAQASDKLGRYGADSAAVSMSGLSSGGYMAEQYQIAHSSQVMGVGIVAAGPWDCAEVQFGWLPIPAATHVCSNTGEDGLPFLGPPDAAPSIAALKDAAQAHRVDATRFLTKSRVFLFSGSRDSLEPQGVMDALNAFYLAFVPPGRIRYVRTVPAEHAMPTDGFGHACGHLGSPYINDCGYDATGEMLTFIYGSLKAPGDPSTGKLIEFDQAEFLPHDPISMAPVGHAFVPAECQTAPGCRLHVAFHGCLQSQDLIGDAFYAHAGYNRWAATNRIIVLYPQVVASNFAPFNPRGCWDWFAYTGSDYETRSGKQIAAISKMIARVNARAKP